MTELIELVREEGEPHDQVIVSKDEAEQYRGKVPDALIEFWCKHGRGSYRNGKDWICNPAPFVPVVENVFKNDPDFHADELVVIKRSAFAELMMWSRRLSGPITIDFNTGNVAAFGPESWIDAETGQRHTNDYIVGALFYRSKNVAAWVTDDDRDMLPFAVERCGPLGFDELYGFFPALQLGGQNEVGNVRRVKAVEHLLFLAEITDFELARTVFPDHNDPGGYYREVVRPIGRRL